MQLYGGKILNHVNTHDVDSDDKRKYTIITIVLLLAYQLASMFFFVLHKQVLFVHSYPLETIQMNYQTNCGSQMVFAFTMWNKNYIMTNISTITFFLYIGTLHR